MYYLVLLFVIFEVFSFNDRREVLKTLGEGEKLPKEVSDAIKSFVEEFDGVSEEDFECESGIASFEDFSSRVNKHGVDLSPWELALAFDLENIVDCYLVGKSINSTVNHLMYYDYINLLDSSFLQRKSLENSFQGYCEEAEFTYDYVSLLMTVIGEYCLLTYDNLGEMRKCVIEQSDDIIKAAMLWYSLTYPTSEKIAKFFDVQMDEDRMFQKIPSIVKLIIKKGKRMDNFTIGHFRRIMKVIDEKELYNHIKLTYFTETDEFQKVSFDFNMLYLCLSSGDYMCVKKTLEFGDFAETESNQFVLSEVSISLKKMKLFYPEWYIQEESKCLLFSSSVSALIQDLLVKMYAGFLVQDRSVTPEVCKFARIVMEVVELMVEKFQDVLSTLDCDEGLKEAHREVMIEYMLKIATENEMGLIPLVKSMILLSKSMGIELDFDLLDVDGILYKNRGYALVHEASDSGAAEIIQILCEEGADLNLKNKLGMTALSIARIRNYENVEKVLMECGAKGFVEENEELDEGENEEL